VSACQRASLRNKGSACILGTRLHGCDLYG